MRTTQVKQATRKEPRKLVWRFADAPNTGVYTTKKIMSGEDPVTRVFHDADDGAWQFHGPGKSKPKDAVYVCLHCIVDKDESINQLADLSLGWCAWRKAISSQWKRGPQDEGA